MVVIFKPAKCRLKYYSGCILFLFFLIKNIEIPIAVLKRIIKLAEKNIRMNKKGLSILYALIMEKIPKAKKIILNSIGIMPLFIFKNFKLLSSDFKHCRVYILMGTYGVAVALGLFLNSPNN